MTEGKYTIMLKFLRDYLAQLQEDLIKYHGAKSIIERIVKVESDIGYYERHNFDRDPSEQQAQLATTNN